MRRRHDPYWKGILEEVFDDFLKFVFPDAEKELDFGKKFEFLDKELGKIGLEADEAKDTRYVDKLVKVFLRNGQDRWILVHVEVQGDRDANFARRMFAYYYRIMDRFSRPVTAIAIFSGADGKRMPGQFEDKCMGTRLLYQYNTLTITDYSESDLIQGENPFALVLLVAKIALKKGRPMDRSLLRGQIAADKASGAKGVVYQSQNSKGMLVS